MLHELHIALAVTLVALAAVSAVNSASALGSVAVVAGCFGFDFRRVFPSLSGPV